MTFYETLTAAVADFAEHGYDHAERLEFWLTEIRRAAQAEMIPEWRMVEIVRGQLGTVYQREVERGGLLKWNPGVSRFKLEQLRPTLHAELQRRIMASADLIRRNREAAITRTLQRLSGWATAQPAGGSRAVDRVPVKTDIRKALAQLPFEERRVAIDQGHKFVSSLNTTFAENSGAIAGMWHSHWRQKGYNYRKDHKERDDHVYAVRNNWALEKGLMNKGAGYTDEITQPGEEPFCRCFYQYLYNLRQLPLTMLTKKGADALEAVRITT